MSKSTNFNKRDHLKLSLPLAQNRFLEKSYKVGIFAEITLESSKSSIFQINLNEYVTHDNVKFLNYLYFSFYFDVF